MDIKDFIANFADQFDEIDVEKLTAETNFRELDEWSSIVALSVMAMIDDEYDIQIKAEEMRQSQTLQQLYDIVSSKL